MTNEFKSKMGVRPVTDVCKKGVGEVKGKSIAVVDTPDLFHTTLSNAEIQEEIVKCITLLAPGTHAFIIVITVGRYTEDVIILHLIEMMFGLKAGQFSIVLFTRADDLETESIEDFVKSRNCANLNRLIKF